KPENIFLTSSGLVKVLDFGLARTEERFFPQTSNDADTLTLAGTIMGTPGYLSPEQLHALAAGPVSDLFSFGCILYEMSSGKRAFRGKTTMELMTSILRDTPPDPGLYGIAVPSDLNQLILHCLEKDPKKRLQTAHQVTQQLRAILSASNAPASSHTA